MVYTEVWICRIGEILL